MENTFKQLLETCGLSQPGAARLLKVRYDTVRNWYYGKVKVPQGVVDDLTKYAEQAKKIFNHC